MGRRKDAAKEEEWGGGEEALMHGRVNGEETEEERLDVPELCGGKEKSNIGGRTNLYWRKVKWVSGFKRETIYKYEMRIFEMY